ncbi:MAG: hypothetical protein ACXV76_13600 [Halobacteriota archaeon]
MKTQTSLPSRSLLTKERWARPDSNRRPPPCEGGGFRAYSAIFMMLESILCYAFGRNDYQKGERPIVHSLDIRVGRPTKGANVWGRRIIG